MKTVTTTSSQTTSLVVECDDTVEWEDGIEWEKVEIMPAQRGYMTSQLCKTMTKTVAALHV